MTDKARELAREYVRGKEEYYWQLNSVQELIAHVITDTERRKDAEADALVARAALDALVAERVREAQDDIFVALCNAIGERPFTWDTKKNEESAKLFVERIVKEAVGKELSDAIGNAAMAILRRELDMLHTRLQQAEAELADAKKLADTIKTVANRELKIAREELATLRQQMEPSRCGVKGHLRLHQKDRQVIYTDGTPSRDLEVVCTACESQRQEREATTAQNKALLDALEERLEVWRNRITSIRVMFPGDQAPIEICADELESLLREHGRLG